MEYLQAKFSCDNDGGQFRGMTNYENMMNYFTEIRRRAEKLRNNKNQSILGVDEDAEHDFKITRLNNRKEKIRKSAEHNVHCDAVKYDSDSSIPSSFSTDRLVIFSNFTLNQKTIVGKNAKFV